MKINTYLESKFKDGVQFILEATNFESFMLWKEDNDMKRYQSGVGINIGNINDDHTMPVWLCIGISNYKGFKYLEYEVTSRFSDHKMVEEWLHYHFRGIPQTNANNSHILKHAADKWLEKHNENTTN